MIGLGDKIALLRKERGLSREELALQVGTSAPIIGRYERGEITPSVEVAAKIASALEVSLDYLAGSGELKAVDKATLKRLEDIQNLPEADRTHILYALDNLITAAKLRTL